MPLRTEDRLLICLARTRLNKQQEQKACALLQGPVDWAYFKSQAMSQGVSGLCYARMVELRQKGFRTEPELLEAAAKTIAARSLLLASRLLAILDSLEGAGIRAVPYKGPVLAMQCYGSLAARDFIDLDLIVRHQDLPRVWRLLRDEGYQMRSPVRAPTSQKGVVPGQYEFLPPAKDFPVEIHTERTLRHFPRRLPPELFLTDLKPVQLLGRKVPTFSAAGAMTFLCVHHSKDFWSRLLWLCDVAELIQSEEFDWREALARARALGCLRMVHLGVLLVANVLESSVPPDVRREAEADTDALADAEWVAPRLFAPEPIGPWEQLRYRMRMVEGFWPGIRYVARLATAPAADDWNALRLPAPLGFAYPLLRPFRLLCRHNR